MQADPDLAGSATRSGPRPGPGLLLALAGMALFGAGFFWSQNVAGHVGGNISLEKVFWLCYALTILYVVPAFLVADRRVSPALRGILQAHLLWWGFRAVAELFLMYVVHLWRPPMGMAHDAVAIALVAGLLWQRRGALRAPTFADTTAIGYLVLLMASLVPEICFAWLFYQAVGGETARVWFADDSARFAFINAITRVVDGIVYPLLAWLVVRYYAPAPGS